MRYAGLTDVFRVREFRVLFGAALFSVAGDQLARIALAVLVYARTGSATWAAGTYAFTFLPALLGGVLLGWTADRLRRREVMVAADLLRAPGIVTMALPGVPLWVLGVLLVVVVLLGAPHAAAEGALLPEILTGDRYERGLAVRQISGQTAQLAGFACGGVVVAALGPASALAVDAVTFLLSAVIIRVGLADRPVAALAQAGGAGVRGVLNGFTTIVADRRRLTLVALAWTIGAFVVPEGLAVPYAAQLGQGLAAVGLLMAADPLGSVLGVWAFSRFVPGPWRERLVGVVAVAAGLPLLLVAWAPGLLVSVALWALAGACSAVYLLQTQAIFVRATPSPLRGSAIGVAASGIVASQGLAVFVGGLLADATGPATAIALCGAAGSVVAAALALLWWRHGHRRTVMPRAPVARTRSPAGLSRPDEVGRRTATTRLR